MSSPAQSLLTDLQGRVADLLRASPAGDIERNVKALLGQTFQRLDLVTREEFDVQAALLDRLRARVVDLEARLAVLEARAAGVGSGGLPSGAGAVAPASAASPIGAAEDVAAGASVGATGAAPGAGPGPNAAG